MKKILLFVFSIFIINNANAEVILPKGQNMNVAVQASVLRSRIKHDKVNINEKNGKTAEQAENYRENTIDYLASPSGESYRASKRVKIEYGKYKIDKIKGQTRASNKSRVEGSASKHRKWMEENKERLKHEKKVRAIELDIIREGMSCDPDDPLDIGCH